MIEINPLEIVKQISEYISFVFKTFSDPRHVLNPISVEKSNDSGLIFVGRHPQHSAPELIVNPKLIFFSILSIIIGVVLQNTVLLSDSATDFVTPIVVTLVMWTLLSSILFFSLRRILPNNYSFIHFLSGVFQISSAHYVLASLAVFLVAIYLNAPASILAYFLFQITFLPFNLTVLLIKDSSSIAERAVTGIIVYLIIIIFLTASLSYNSKTGNNPLFPAFTPTPTATSIPTLTPTWTRTATPTPTETSIPTVTPEFTATSTPSVSSTPTLPTSTSSPTATRIATNTVTPSPTGEIECFDVDLFSDVTLNFSEFISVEFYRSSYYRWRDFSIVLNDAEIVEVMCRYGTCRISESNSVEYISMPLGFQENLTIRKNDQYLEFYVDDVYIDNYPLSNRDNLDDISLIIRSRSYRYPYASVCIETSND